MPVLLTGRDLTLEDVALVARAGESVALEPEALDAMRAARDVVDRARERGGDIYGVTTGVGMRKAFRVEDAGHERLLVRQHLIGQGAGAPHEVVRATVVCLVNVLLRGTTPARPELAELLAGKLNSDLLPAVRTLGSIGQADLAPLAELAEGVLEGFELAAGEAIALLNENAFATGWGALALRDVISLLDTADVAGALSLEAFGANRNLLEPAIADARPYPGLRDALTRLAALLDGSDVESRNLQDPLSFRTMPQLHGAARDAIAFARRQVEIELNAAQSNPLVVVAADRVVSVGNFDAQPLATALDLVRLALAPVLTSAAERAVKLLQASLTGLPEGLGARPALAESALSELGIAVQAFAAEARLLAQPVSLELVSTTQAEGIEDRTTMAPLASRRVAEMAALGARVIAVELLHAAQASELRGARLGRGTDAARRAVRERAPFVAEGDPLPDLEPLVQLVRSGALGQVPAP